MKNPFVKFSLFLLEILLLLCLCPINGFAQTQDTIAAIVNNDVITYRDLKEYLKSRLLQLKLEGVPAEEIKTMMADLEADGIHRLIQDKLLINEANQKGIQVHKEAVNDRIQQIEHNYSSEEMFLRALDLDGVSLSDLRKKIEDQIKVQQLIETEIKNKIYVNPQEITDYYNANLASFKRPERVNLDSIYIAKKDDPASKTKIREALTMIQAGQDFRKVAEKYSSTPALGNFEKGKLLPELEQTAWSLAVGKCSDVIEVQDGFYILKVLGKTPAQTAPLEDVKDNIQKIVLNEKIRKKMDDWLGQLEKTNFVEIRGEESQ